MNVATKDRDEAACAEYLKAFIAANPDSPLPRLTYENGWWCISTGAKISVRDSRYRASDLHDMTKALRARAQQRLRARFGMV